MRPALALVAICVPVFVGALDLTVVSAVLPAVLVELRAPLQSGLATGSWAVSGYFAAYVFGMLTMGRVSDLVGRRQAFLVALAVFFAGSWWAAASADAPAQWLASLERAITGARPDTSLARVQALVVGRVVQGLGAGSLVPIALAVVADLFPPGRRAALIGVVVAVDTAGWILGHLYGGLAVQLFPWQFLFWSNLPIAAAGAALAWRALAGLTRGDPRAAMDWPGTVLLGLALAGLTIALGGNDVATSGGLAAPVTAPSYAFPLLVVAGVASALFVAAELRSPAPLVELRLFADRLWAGASLSNLFLGFCVMVSLVSVPLLVNVIGARTSREGALVSGELLSAFTVPLAVAAVPGGLLAHRLGTIAASAVGFAAAAAGFLLVSRWEPEVVRLAVATLGGRVGWSADVWRQVVPLLAGLVLAGTGLGLASAPLAATLLDPAPAARRGSTAALLVALRLGGMTVAVSALTSYGLRRLAALAQERLAGLSLGEPQRLLDASQRIATQVSDEMSLVAAALCVTAMAVTLVVARPGQSRS